MTILGRDPGDIEVALGVSDWQAGIEVVAAFAIIEETVRTYDFHP